MPLNVLGLLPVVNTKHGLVPAVQLTFRSDAQQSRRSVALVDETPLRAAGSGASGVVTSYSWS